MSGYGERPVFCRKDGKRLREIDDGLYVFLECPSIRKWWLPGISTDWESHTNFTIGRSSSGFDEATGERKVPA